MTSVRRVQLPEETSPRTSRIKKHGSHLLDRVPMDNEDAVNVVAFSPGRRGSWSVVRHSSFEKPVREAVLWLLRMNAQLKGKCSWQVWYRIIAFVVETEPKHPIMASGSGVSVQMWRGSKRIASLRGHVSIVRTLAFAHPTGEVLASGSYDNTIRIWRQRSKARDRNRRENALSGRTELCRKDDEAEVGFIWQGRPVSKIPPKRQPLKYGEKDDDWICTATLLGHSREVLAVAIAPTTTCSASNCKSAINPNKTSHILRSQSSQSLASSIDWYNEMPRDLLLVSSSWDGSCRVWSVDAAERGESAFLYAILSSSGAVRSVSFSPDGTIFAAGSDDAIVRIRTPGRVLADNLAIRSEEYDDQNDDKSETTLDKGVIELRGHTSWVYSVAFSTSRSDILASGSQDCTVRIWTRNQEDEYLPSIWTASACIIRHHGWVYSVAFSYDGRFIASAAADGHVKLHRISVPSETDSVDNSSIQLQVESIDEIHEAHEGVVYSVAFPNNPCHQRRRQNTFIHFPSDNEDNEEEVIGFASGSVDGTIGLWSIDAK